MVLVCFAAAATAQDGEYYVAVAVTHTTSFAVGTPWFVDTGWHEDSGAEATAEAVAACQKASEGAQFGGKIHGVVGGRYRAALELLDG